MAQREVVGDGLEVGGQLAGALIAVAGLGLQAMADDGLERRGDLRVGSAKLGQGGEPIVGRPQAGPRTTDVPVRGDANGRWPVTAS